MASKAFKYMYLAVGKQIIENCPMKFLSRNYQQATMRPII
jgi:hypothetical protein